MKFDAAIDCAERGLRFQCVESVPTSLLTVAGGDVAHRGKPRGGAERVVAGTAGLLLGAILIAPTLLLHILSMPFVVFGKG